jgi:hypothetical protein
LGQPVGDALIPMIAPGNAAVELMHTPYKTSLDNLAIASLIFFLSA